MDKSSFELPHMKNVFDALRKGRHICPDDGGLFIALRDNRDEYENLFTNLGFRFREHPRGFFYFSGDSQLSEGAERIAVFMFVLIESLATEGHPVEEALMTRRYNPQALPHFQATRPRQYMKDVGLQSPEDLSNLLKNMERLGFVETAPDETFRFRLPACRFLELCTEFIDDVETEEIDE